MCQTLRLPDRDIETLGELKAMWPVLVPARNYGPEDLGPGEDDCCLCPVNIEASAEANGAKVLSGYSMDYMLDV